MDAGPDPLHQCLDLLQRLHLQVGPDPLLVELEVAQGLAPPSGPSQKSDEGVVGLIFQGVGFDPETSHLESSVQVSCI